MKTFVCLIVALPFIAHAQTIQACKQRFDTYLNFHNSLNKTVRFEQDAFFLMKQGKKEFAVYANEAAPLSLFFQNSTLEQQEMLYQMKGVRRLTSRELDSLTTTLQEKTKPEPASALHPLKGYRIAIDPGHFSTTLSDAESEQKYLLFVPDSLHAPYDTIKIFESQLTYNTAHILKGMLQDKGAEVLLTRDQPGFTSFNCTYTDWIKLYKKRTLDSLYKTGGLTAVKYKKLLSCSKRDFFWDFFRDYDLVNRAKKINAFSPHATAIIHFNVDEKNAPWKKQSKNNFSMVFIGGAFTEDGLNKKGNKLDFLRLMITDQLNRSESLAARTVSNFNEILEIPIAKAVDADYLKNNSMITLSPGVFCRNLALCRKINSPLVYGESLYQDNENECRLLMRCDMDMYGVKANDRLRKVALSYYSALFSFLKS
jgi:N-acetylmuramoyl-L-alanine amidase